MLLLFFSIRDKQSQGIQAQYADMGKGIDPVCILGLFKHGKPCSQSSLTHPYLALTGTTRSIDQGQCGERGEVEMGC